MTDNMKGLLDLYEDSYKRGAPAKFLRGVFERLRTAMEGMENEYTKGRMVGDREGYRRGVEEAERERDELKLRLDLTSAEHASCHDEAAHHKREEWQAEIKELKRRLEGAHIRYCECEDDDIEGDVPDPRCLALREGKNNT